MSPGDYCHSYVATIAMEHSHYNSRVKIFHGDINQRRSVIFVVGLLVKNPHKCREEPGTECSLQTVSAQEHFALLRVLVHVPDSREEGREL